MYRKLSAIIVPTVIAIGILGYMIYRIWDQLLLALENIVPEYLAIGVLICISAWWLRGLRYRSILKSLGYHVSVTFSTACIFVSQTVNLVVPARLGDFVRVFILKHEYATTYSEGISSLVVERVFDIVTVALLGAVSVFFVLNAPAWFYTIIILPLAAGLVFFAFLIFSKDFTSENRYITLILNMLHEIRRASLSLRSVVVLGCSSVVIWLLDVLVCLAVVMMFRQDIPFAIIILAIVVGNLVKAVPLTPGGLLTYEAALTATFTLTGVPLDVAFMIAVIDHLIKNLVTLAGGIVSVYYLGDWVMPTIRTALDSKFGRGEPPVT
jgi:uncharacterized protein (TIRG00374 family)